MNYKCCKTKPISHYVCTNCSGVFHKSCLLSHYKKKVVFSKENKIVCCKVKNESDQEEMSLLEKTISELVDDGELKTKYIEKLIKEKNHYLQQAVDMETDMNNLLESQKTIVKEMEDKIQELQKQIIKKVHSVRSISTQTSILMSHKSTTTDPLTSGGSEHDLRILKNKSISDRGTQTVSPSDKNENSSCTKTNMKGKKMEVNKIINIKRLLLISNYHGRNMAEHLVNQMNQNYEIQTLIKTNANFDELLKTANENVHNLTRADILVLWPKDIDISKLKMFVNEVTHTNTIIMTEPYCFDRSKNNRIYENNLTLSKEIHRMKSTFINVFECNNHLRMRNFYRNGYNLKKSGIYFVSKAMVNYIKTKTRVHGKQTEKNGEALVSSEHIDHIHLEEDNNLVTQYEITSNNSQTFSTVKNLLKKTATSSTEVSKNKHFLYPRLSQEAPKDV